MGNRTFGATGSLPLPGPGNSYFWRTTGAGTRWANYTNNLLNQLTSRSVPSKFDVMGSATNNSTVTVNNEPTSRKSDFYRAELTVDTATGPAYVSITNLSVLNNGSSTNDLIANQIGNVFIPQSPEQLTYDLDGNLLTDGRWTYSWDGENRLVTMTGNTNVPTAARLKLEFTYDWRGRRISKKTSTWNGSSYVAQSTNRFLYDGWNLVAEADVASGTLLRSYVWGLDLSGTSQGAGGVGGLAITVVHTGTEAGSYFVAFDGNGNVGGIVRSSDGVVRAVYEYGPFGEVIGTSGPVAKINPFRFSTKYQDDESDLLYYGYRFYSPITGRWPNRDPLEEQGGANLYSMVANDPISNYDYLGLLDGDTTGALTGGAGGGAVFTLTGNTPIGNGFYMSGVDPNAFKGNTSVLFIYQKSNPRIIYRLDNGPIVKGPYATTANVWHHNLSRVQQKLNLSVANHEAGPGATAAGRAVTLYKWGGRALFVLGVANSAAEIYYAEDKQREIVVQIGGWSGAWAGARIGAWGGARAGAYIGGAVTAPVGGEGAVPGAAIGGLVGGLGGGAFGFFVGSKTTRYVYDTFFYPLTKEEWLVACGSPTQ